MGSVEGQLALFVWAEKSVLSLKSALMEVSSSSSSTSGARWSSASASYGEETFAKIQNAKVLVIGSGGIGCELLKNLVLSGFKYIEIVRDI